jgi:hypothetical protein
VLAAIGSPALVGTRDASKIGKSERHRDARRAQTDCIASCCDGRVAKVEELSREPKAMRLMLCRPNLGSVQVRYTHHL